MTTVEKLKRSVLRVITHPFATMPLRAIRRHRAAVFMLHRFTHPDRGVTGDDPAVLRHVLQTLRKERRTLMSLSDLLARLETGASVGGAIVFTIDDGYLEQAEVAAPAFAEFDCPVTTFVTSGFLDGTLWFWWDKIEFVFLRTTRRSLTVRLGSAERTYAWAEPAGRDAAIFDFTEACKSVPDEEKHAAIARLAELAEVALPAAAPSQYAPMTWAQLAAAERGGMTFGPHTVTHPILSRTSDGQARREITESWQRLVAHATSPVPVFCYPNGRPQDFGAREYAIMRDTGIRAAVVGSPGYATAAKFAAAADARFNIPRFSYLNSLVDTRQVISGLEYVKARLRGATWD